MFFASHTTRTLALLTSSIVFATGCAQQPEFTPPPAALTAPTEVPPAPYDAARPLDQVVWVMQYDMREFDETLRWLREEVPDSEVRQRALGVAVLLGVFELSRFELIDEGVQVLEQAITAYPDDPRMVVFRDILLWQKAYQAGDRAGVEEAYDALRVAAERYPAFSLFGLTLTIAGDRGADDALVDEALVAYEEVLGRTADHQFGETPELARRLGDWERLPNNIIGTSVLIGDLAALEGDVELAQRSYYTALHANAGYRWPWRAEVERRLGDVEGVGEAMRRGDTEVPMFGAQWRGARGSDEDVTFAPLAGRVGNGSCTMCHTAMTAMDTPDLEPAEVGWVRVTYQPPESSRYPFPNFFALDEASDEGIPQGFAIGQIDLPGFGGALGDGTYELMIPSMPGEWFIAGQIDGSEFGAFDDETYGTFTSRSLGRPRFVEVRAGEVTDLSDEVLVFEPEE